MIEFVNSADQLSLGAVMTRHDRTVLRRTEWRSLAVIMITTDSLVDEETRQRSQMTCTRWDITISYIVYIHIWVRKKKIYLLICSVDQSYSRELQSEASRWRSVIGWRTLAPSCQPNSLILRVHDEEDDLRSWQSRANRNLGCNQNLMCEN